MTESWRNRSEGGTPFALRATAWIALHLNRAVLTAVLASTALYFMCMRKAERRASRNFLSRALGREATLGDVYRHFRTFARVTADRVFFLSDRLDRIDLEVHGWDVMERFVKQGRGCVMLGSHLGSFEATRAAATRHQGVNIRMVLDRAVGRKLIEALKSVDPNFETLLIDADQEPASLGLEIAETLRAGESVGFLADRYRPGDRTAVCEFMGAPARFPAGPLMIAAALKAPVVLLFSTYANGKYVVRCEEFSDEFVLPRANRSRLLQAQIQRYAGRLANYVEKAPYNWFNFYDFWASDPE